MELECLFVKAENLATFVNPVSCNIAVNIQTLIYFSFMLSHKKMHFLSIELSILCCAYFSFARLLRL